MKSSGRWSTKSKYSGQDVALKRVLITGASGNLGAYVVRELQRRGSDFVLWSGARTGDVLGVPVEPVELADAERITSAFKVARPALVIHAAAVASPAECFRNPARARQINVEASAILADLAAQSGARLLLVSTDLVFDGEQGAYRETDTPRPLSVYGHTKLAAEKAVLAHPRSMVARISLLFGPTLIQRPSFFDEQVSALRERRPCNLFADEWRTPLGLESAARALIALVHSDFEGTVHVGGPERLSRLEMGLRLAHALHDDPSVFVGVSRESIGSREPRPRDLSLDSTLWKQLFPQEPRPAFEDALGAMLVSKSP
jgi:dTDP-4-dehydrorhamnose reductase